MSFYSTKFIQTINIVIPFNDLLSILFILLCPGLKKRMSEKENVEKTNKQTNKQNKNKTKTKQNKKKKKKQNKKQKLWCSIIVTLTGTYFHHEK